MASSTGIADTFDPEVEQYESYRERIDQYFIANDITDDKKKVAVILSVMGAKEYGLLKSIVAPKMVTELKLSEIDEVLKQHYNPKPPVMLERFKLYQRNQRPDETIATYFAELKKMAASCDFNTFRSEALRDRLVCGLLDKNIQKRLLSEDNLTIDKATKLALSMEAASQNAEYYKQTARGTVLAQTFTMPMGQLNASAVAEKDMKKDIVAIKDYSCDVCHRKGHLKQMCRNNERQGSHSSSSSSRHRTEKSSSNYKGRSHMKSSKGHEQRRKSRRKSRVGVSHVEGDESNSHSSCTDSSDSGSESDEQMYYIGVHEVGKGVKPIMADVEIENTSLQMEVDTGCGVSIVSKSFFDRELKKKVNAERTDIRLKTFTGEVIPVIGKCQVNVTY